MSAKIRKLTALFLLCVLMGALTRVTGAQPWTFQRIQNYPYASDYDFNKVRTGCQELRTQLRKANAVRNIPQKARLERFLSEVEAFTQTKTVRGERVSIVNFATSEDKAVKMLREVVCLKPPRGGAIVRVYDSKQIMPKAILDLFEPNAGGVTRWCRYSVIVTEGKSDDEITDTTAHELAHAYVGAYLDAGTEHLPRWFHEGSALYVSGARERYLSVRDFGSRVSFSPPDYDEYRIVFEYMNDYAGGDRVAKFIRDTVIQRNTTKPLQEAMGIDTYGELRKRAIAWNEARRGKDVRWIAGVMVGGVLLLWIATKRRQVRIRRALALISEATVLAKAGLIREAEENLVLAARLESYATRVRMAAQIAREEIHVQRWRNDAGIHNRVQGPS
ncbi:MAG: hypothetical protein WCL39_00865 [Armatimonadota bacterium]